MGVCISKVSTGSRGLEFTRGNEQLLSDLLAQLDVLSKNNPEEAAVPFQVALTWKTKQPDTVFNSVPADGRGPDGKALFSCEGGLVTVRTIALMDAVFNACGDARMAEMKQALEANPDPVGKILGKEYGHGASLIDVMEKHQHETATSADKLRFRLVLLLHHIDVKLLRTSVETMAQEVRLNITSVESEVELLKSLSGHEKHNVLEAVHWDSAYKASNGVRAPPWRQINGDLAYIAVKPAQQDVFMVMANVHGYWVIKGTAADGSMDYEKEGDTYPTLVALLRVKSPHFADTIDNQEMVYRASDSSSDMTAATSKKMKDFLSQQPDDTPSDAEKPAASMRATQGRGKGGGRARAGGSRALQPSDKWAALGMTGKGAPPKASLKPASASKRASSRSSVSSARSNVFMTQSPRLADARVDGMETEEDPEEAMEERKIKVGDLPPEYWNIQRLVKYLAGGNQTAAIIALCSFKDYDMTSASCQYAIRDVGGLEVLINLLETDHTKCKIGALQVLRDASLGVHVRKAMADNDAMQPLVKALGEPDQTLQALAAETIANCARLKRNRRMVAAYGGLERCVAMLDQSGDSPSEDVARGGALALWECCKSPEAKERVLSSNIIPLLSSLLKTSTNPALLVGVVGIVEECATLKAYRDAFRDQGMTPKLVEYLSHEDKSLQAHCASAIFHCAEDAATRKLVREQEGLAPLVAMLSNKTMPELLAGATGAIWKCALDPEAKKALTAAKAVENLVGLLSGQPEEVITNTAGAISALGDTVEARKAVRSAGGLTHLVGLLSGTNDALLINVCKAIGCVAQDKESMAILASDGVRLLWSLLRSSNTQVVSAAGWAICPCIKNASEAGNLVRSFVGGLELVVGLLESENIEVVASVCAAIAEIAKDQENLAVITDHEVVRRLGRLAKADEPVLRQNLKTLSQTEMDHLQENLANAIANCCFWRDNRAVFGEQQAVAPLYKFLLSREVPVQRATARALHQLSKDPANCITMHRAGVVRPLIDMVGSQDAVLQEAAAYCLRNIRTLALANEMHHYG